MTTFSEQINRINWLAERLAMAKSLLGKRNTIRYQLAEALVQVGPTLLPFDEGELKGNLMQKAGMVATKSAQQKHVPPAFRHLLWQWRCTLRRVRALDKIVKKYERKVTTASTGSLKLSYGDVIGFKIISGNKAGTKAMVTFRFQGKQVTRHLLRDGKTWRGMAPIKNMGVIVYDIRFDVASRMVTLQDDKYLGIVYETSAA